jgi:hypothetical protein
MKKLLPTLLALCGLSMQANAANSSSPIDPAKISAINESAEFALMIGKYHQANGASGIDLECSFDQASELASGSSGFSVIAINCGQFFWMNDANGGARGCGTGADTELIAVIKSEIDLSKPNRPVFYKVRSLTPIDL